MPRYGMVVDLRKCIGCQSCVVACKSEHNTPTGILQTNVLERELGKFPNVVRVFLPVLCNHCEEPTCVEVCPSEARIFGDLKRSQPTDPIRKFYQNNRLQALKAHLGTEPRVLYAGMDKEVS